MYKKIMVLIAAVFFLAICSQSVLAMNKGELVDAIAKDAGLSKADAGKALNVFLRNTAKTLKKGNSVPLVGFGSLSVSDAGKVVFAVDRPLADAVYPVFVENFWSDVNRLNADDLRQRFRGHVTVLKRPEGASGNSAASLKVAIKPIRLELSLRDYFSVQSQFAETFSELLSIEDPARMLSAGQRDSYAAFLTDNLDHAASTLISSPSATEPVQKQSALNMRSAVVALVNQAQSMAGDYLDEDSDGDSLGALIRRTSRQSGLGISEVTAAYKAMIAAMTSALEKGDRVNLGRIGGFSISNRAARTGRNPQTGATIKIAAKKVVKFKAGKALADTVK